MPSHAPYSQPSFQPSLQPNNCPIDLPTCNPSVRPIKNPSPHPSLQPQQFPSFCPIRLPSAKPSRAPSLNPSPQPFYLPKLNPTSSPTVDPSQQPLAYPSCLPTLQPINFPTYRPSDQPTALPSHKVPIPNASKSFLPIMSYNISLWKNTLKYILAANQNDTSSKQLTFSQFDYESTRVYGSCSNWNTFVSNDLVLAQFSYKPYALQLTASTILTDIRNVKCLDHVAVKRIVDGLLSSFSNLTQVSCNDHTWLLSYCSSAYLSVCIDCKDPCDTRIEGSVIHLAPCAIASTGIQVFNILYQNRYYAPRILNLNASSTSTTVCIRGKLSSAGTLFCAISADSSFAPSTISEISQQNYAAVSDRKNVSTILISGLEALTTYRFYCYSSAFTATSSLSDIRKTRTIVNTTCCKTMYVTQKSASLTTGQTVLRFITIQLSSPPKKSLKVSISFNSSLLVKSGDMFLPSKLEVSNTSLSLSYDIAVRSPFSGTFLYFIRLSGASSEEYSVDYLQTIGSVAGSTFTVIPIGHEPATPRLSSVRFSDDGAYVIISFDSPTNKGSLPSIFQCDRLFAFACANMSQCQWMNGSTAFAYIYGSSSCARPGDMFRISRNNSLKAACFTTNNSCSSATWSTVSAIALSIGEATSPINPSVVVNAPTVIGACDNLALDLSLSTGNGGRPWKSISVTVQSDVSNNISHLQRCIQVMSFISTPAPIPYFIFRKGFAYSFHVIICNFLSTCGESTKVIYTVDSMIPSVILPGDPIQKVYRYNILSIGSITTVAFCSGSNTPTAIDYQWSILRGGTFVLNRTSISNDKSKFVLPKYSLRVNTYYLITLSATILSTKKTSSVSTTVFVKPGNLHAIVTGGLVYNMQVASSIKIDGSRSYDDDQSGVSGASAGLSFSWQCIQVSPVLVNYCSTHFNISDKSSFLLLISRLNSEGVVASVSLTVSDNYRSAQTSTTVNVLGSTSSIVSVVSNLPGTAFNPSSTLQLTGSLVVPNIENTTAYWTVNDDSIVLDDVATSAARFRATLLSSFVYMTIPPNILIGGATLVFTLHCKTNLEVSFVSASVTVSVNSPPRPGVFRVNPASGIEFQTNFLFSSDLWTDSNLPLSYQYGYYSALQIPVTLQSRFVTTYGSSFLPAGKGDNKNLVMFVEVFDELNANNTAMLVVRVETRFMNAMDKVSFLISSTSNLSLLNIDEVKKLTSFSSYILNSVNCSVAPNCSHLNRLNCVATINTCGACKSDQYIGAVGDSNSMCVLRTASLKSSCPLSSSCSEPQVCRNGICVYPMKSCPFNCSDRGKCVYVNVDSGSIVSKCRLNETFCAARCVCEQEFIGSQWCTLNSSELALKQTMRSKVISNINYLVAQEYPDKESVSGWISILADTTQVSDELTDFTVSNVLNLTKAVVSYVNATQLSTVTVAGLLGTMNSAATYNVNKAKSSRRLREEYNFGDTHTTRFLTESSGIPSSLAPVVSAVQLISSAIMSNMLPGQDPFSSVQSQFKLAAVVLAADGQANGVLQLPQSQSEEEQTSRISLSTGNISQASVSLLSLPSSAYDNGEYFTSNPVVLSVSNIPCTQGGSCPAIIELQNYQSSNYSVEGESITVLCKAEVFNLTSYKCRSGHAMNTSCDGKLSAVVRHTCPPVRYVSSCATLSSTTTTNCSLLSYTLATTICMCDIRKQSIVNDSSSTISEERRYELSITSLLVSVFGNSESVILSAGSLSAAEISKEFGVLATFLVLLVFAAVFMSVGHYFDLVDTKKINDEKSVVFKGFALINRLLMPKKAIAPQVLAQNNAFSRRKSEVVILDDALPTVLANRSFAQKVQLEVKHQHRWIGIVYQYSDSFPRSLRVLSLIINIVVMLFVQSITYNLSNPDTGACQQYETKSACLAPRSTLTSGSNMCSWRASSSSSARGTCAFIEPSDDFLVVLFVAIFSALISTPIAIAQSIIIKKCLVPRLREKQDIKVSPEESEQVAEKQLRPRLSKLLLVEKEMSNLVKKLQSYRNSLSPSKLREFDSKFIVSCHSLLFFFNFKDSLFTVLKCFGD